jgi:hypothetical protein
VEIKRLKQVELRANFEGSMNISILEDEENYKKEEMVTISHLKPFETKIIAKIELKENYSLKSYFGVNMKNISKE